MPQRLIPAMRTDLGEVIIIVLIVGLAVAGYFYSSSRNDAQDASITMLTEQIAKIQMESIQADEKTQRQLEALDQQIAELRRIVTRGK